MVNLTHDVVVDPWSKLSREADLMKQIKIETVKLFQGAPNNLDLPTALSFFFFFFGTSY